MLKTLILLLFLPVLAFAQPATDWTEEEKLNANNFIEAMNESNEATKIFDKQKPFVAVPESEIASIFKHIKNAHEKGLLVTDEVLDKANPQLKEHWHNEFLKGLDLLLSANDNSVPDTTKASIEGQTLLNNFGAWFDSVHTKIKIPK